MGWQLNLLTVNKQVRKNAYDVARYHGSREILNVLVLLVDNLCQFLSVDHFLIYPHQHFLVVAVEFHHILAYDFRYGRAPRIRNKWCG